MAALTPYFFALDHTHYSRWVPVSLYDLENLKHINPEEYGQIEQFFTVSKTRNRYSAMAIDQAHEQNNGRIKNIKGALAFLGTNTKETLFKWSVYSPEFLRLEAEFESATDGEIQSSIGKHHQDSPEFQTTFLSDVKKMVNAVESVFNPFASDAITMRSLRNGLEISRSVEIGESIRSLKQLGQSQFAEFVKERFLKPFPDR